MNFSVKRRKKPNTRSLLRQQFGYFAQIFIQANKKKKKNLECVKRAPCTTKRDEVKYVQRGEKKSSRARWCGVCAGEIMSRGHRGRGRRGNRKQEDLRLAAAQTAEVPSEGALAPLLTEGLSSAASD